jgi:hypothetical protein
VQGIDADMTSTRHEVVFTGIGTSSSVQVYSKWAANRSLPATLMMHLSASTWRLYLRAASSPFCNQSRWLWLLSNRMHSVPTLTAELMAQMIVLRVAIMWPKIISSERIHCPPTSAGDC